MRELCIAKKARQEGREISKTASWSGGHPTENIEGYSDALRIIDSIDRLNYNSADRWVERLVVGVLVVLHTMHAV